MTRMSILGGVICLVFADAGAATAIDCSRCNDWNKERAPFRIFGNTYYVGTHGLSSVLITSESGHVLIDGALPQSAPLIARHVKQLGFKMSDVKFILNSHVQFDHAGGIAELQRMSGARVVASDVATKVLVTGKVTAADPQFNIAIAYPASENVQALGRQESVDLGPLHIKAISTPGHTPGGTSWTWQSCEGSHCMNVVYGDSLTAVSDESFRYSGDERYPTAAADMLRSINVMAALPCDILITPHPEASGLWSVFDEHGRVQSAKLIDTSACRHYAETAQALFEKRLQAERQ